MSDLLVSQSLLPARPAVQLPVPWRDPHTVSKAALGVHIAELEQACQLNPESADLRTCLGMAYAMDLQVHRSEEALDQARELAPDHFWAQFKYAELQYRLRALPLAEQETLRALELASNRTEYAASRRQLQEIRQLIRGGTQKPAWTKPLLAPALATAAVSVFLCLIVLVLK